MVVLLVVDSLFVGPLRPTPNSKTIVSFLVAGWALRSESFNAILSPVPLAAQPPSRPSINTAPASDNMEGNMAGNRARGEAGRPRRPDRGWSDTGWSDTGWPDTGRGLDSGIKNSGMDIIMPPSCRMFGKYSVKSQ